MFNFNNRARPESQALMDYIRGGEPPLNTPDQALSLMRIIDAAYQSSATGAPVRIS
jgi:predicted dehydrogenase